MIRINTGRRAEQLSENLVTNCIFTKATALSLSIVTFGFLAVNRASASDVPLPIKKIALNSENQIVIYFGKREGEFPSPPHLLETPGPNHRITMEFNDSTVDKVNMPAADDLSTKLHKQLPAIKSIRYSTVSGGETPRARVVIELPEQLKVRPRVVKLEEESVTINLADDIVEQSAALEEQSKNPVQSMDMAALNATAWQRKERTEASIAQSADGSASNATDASTAAPVAVTNTGGAKSTRIVAADAEIPVAVKTCTTISETGATADAPIAVPSDKVADLATAATVQSSDTSNSPQALREQPASMTTTAVTEARSETMSQLAESQPTSPKAQVTKEPIVKMPESFANASANLKKFMRWPHRGDSNAAEGVKTADAPKAPAGKSKTIASKAPSQKIVNQLASSDTAPVGAEFNAAFAAGESSAPITVAINAEPTKNASVSAAAESTAAPPGSWDWTTATQSMPVTQTADTKSTAVAAATPAPAKQADETRTRSTETTIASKNSVPEERQTSIEAPAITESEASNSQTSIVAQMPESAPDDRPKISTPIETTETHTFNEPAQVVTPGASTAMTPGAATIIKAKTAAQEQKPVTVAETESSDFAEVLKPAPKPSRAEAEAVAAAESPPIRDSEMIDPSEKNVTEATETAKSPAEAPAKTSSVAETESSDGSKTSVALYNSAVKAHLSGNLAKAIADYKGALAVNPELAEAHSNLGLIYNQQHNYVQAVAEFRKALAINPKDAITYNGIGAALRAQRDLMGAIKNWQTAVSLDPKLATAHYNLGVAYELQRDYDKALASYDQAIKCDYRLGEAYYRMGLIMEKRHHIDEAKAKFKAALKAGENSDYSADARQQLALLESGKTEKSVK